MKPVEIEFLMRDKLSDGLDKAGRSATDLGDKVTRSADQVKAKITEQKAVIKQVENDLKELEKQYAKLAPGAAQAEMKAEIIACKKVLEEEKAALAGVERSTNRPVPPASAFPPSSVRCRTPLPKCAWKERPPRRNTRNFPPRPPTLRTRSATFVRKPTSLHMTTPGFRALCPACPDWPAGSPSLPV